MKGGSRRNAGRPRVHAKISSCNRLDVRYLQQHGYMLIPAKRTLVRWSDGFAARINFSSGIVGLCYVLTNFEREIEVEKAIAITFTRGTYGGQRTWFACPRCGRRVAIIYLDQSPGCRQCHSMAYPSQSENWIRRIWRKEVMIERRLAGGDEKWDYTRPKGMHRSTFQKLTHQRLNLENIRYKEAERIMESTDH